MDGSQFEFEEDVAAALLADVECCVAARSMKRSVPADRVRAKACGICPCCNGVCTLHQFFVACELCGGPKAYQREAHQVGMKACWMCLEKDAARVAAAAAQGQPAVPALSHLCEAGFSKFFCYCHNK